MHPGFVIDCEPSTADFPRVAWGRMTRHLYLAIALLGALQRNAPELLFRDEAARIPQVLRERAVAAMFAGDGPIAHFSVSSFRSAPVLDIRLGVSERIIDEAEMGPRDRARMIVEDVMLPAVHEVGMLAESLPEVTGVRLYYGVPHRAASSTEPPRVQYVEMFYPTAQLRRFLAGTVNAQQLVDSGVLLVNGALGRVTLSAAADDR